MKLERLQKFFSSSPSAKLLRSGYAAQIIYFLNTHFKDAGSITLPHSELVWQLTEFQEQIHQTDPDIMRDRAEAYLTIWSTGENRWLRRFLDSAHAEAVYELTPDAEAVLKFLNSVLDRSLGFIGTESRLRRIIETLMDIVVRGSADPSQRLEHLRAERERIDQEITSIESGDSVSTYSPTAIRERFADAVSDLASLQGDFRAVEESFKTITRDVQKQQTETDGSRGDILGFALDAEDRLKSQDQGISFDEFVRLVLSPSKQDELETIVSRLGEIEALAQQIEGMRRIQGMMGSLSEEAEKVLRTTRRLSSTLRRLLDAHATVGRLRLAAVLREIRAAGARLADNPPGDHCGVEVLTQLDLLNVSERIFWTAPSRFEATELTDHQPDEDDRLAAFRHLAAMQRLDWSSMRQNIASLIQERESVSLSDLLAAHPPTGGAIEILGYVQIAHDDGHEVDMAETEMVYLVNEAQRIAHSHNGDERESGSAFDVPRVIFLSERLQSLRQVHQQGSLTS